MKEMIDYLNEFKNEIVFWLEKPTVKAPVEPMNRIISSIELSIEIVNANRKVSADEKEMFEGGYYLVRYFDGWGENYHTKYSKMTDYIKKNHY